MITINLRDGLGNQMFQYATARALSIRYQVPLTLTTYYFEHIPKGTTPRAYQLDTFDINPDVRFMRTLSPVRRIWQKALAKLYKEKARILFARLLLSMKAPVHLSGWFQNPVYFSSIRDTLLEEFSFIKPMSDMTKKLSADIEGSRNATAVNIRRGDYLRPDWTHIFGVLTMQYYTDAIAIIQKKVSNPVFYIFSDDPEWAKENFIFDKTVFVGTDEFTDYEQLYLMTRCKHNIIANSTFAWWGAWLGTNDDKIVIAPKQWAVTETANDLEILPKNWTQL